MYSTLHLLRSKLKASLLQQNSLSIRHFKVAIVGANGGIGQNLCLLLKQNPLVKELILHDLTDTEGVGADVAHISTNAVIHAFHGDKCLKQCLCESDIIIVPAGMPRKPGMTRADLFSANASVASKVALAVSEVCPKAMLAFITNPINTIVPIAAEILKAKDKFDPNRLFGVTTLDVVRSKTFVADLLNINPQTVQIPVIGGHAGITILPLLSQCKPCFSGTLEDIKRLTHRIQEAGTEVVKAKAGKGSATLSMAYAGSHFVNALLRAMNGDENIVECAYVASDVTELPFFATPLLLGPEGVKKNLGIPELEPHEEEALKELLPILKKNIDAGLSYVEFAAARGDFCNKDEDENAEGDDTDEDNCNDAKNENDGEDCCEEGK